ncbi:restriction endonuclease subunit S [Aeromonas dhakensis]|uniref:restriction endonuclease subunit S n=1 Tax=Aeromonas dhakensis TaxID=196024 RepID=UPI001CF05522|nr:restriction endonuclease subunit S [Aeromonas dhakensis]UCM44844.1 restriction endonuclease subunit S [Aeromonas dhakensis]
MTWPMVKLGEIFKITSGGTPSRSKSEYYENGSIAWIKTGDLHNKFITHASEFITEAGLQSSSTRIYPKNTILVAMYGATIGACSILKIEACTNQACAAFTPNEKVDTLFLYYLLKYSQPKFINAGAGGAQPNISATFLKNFEIPLPPLDEQKRIAAILDKADAIRQKRQQAIALADDFLHSVFLDMFGDPVTNPKEWDIYPLRNGITNITAGWSANGENHSCGDDEIGVLKISAVTSGIFKPNENKVVSSSNIPSNKKLVFPRKGDLLFSRANTRELVGATCIVDSDYDNVFLPDKLWVINLNSNELLPEYVHMLVQHPKFKECLTSQATGSSGSMLNISKVKFEGTLAPYPSLDVQQRFKDIFWKVMTCNALTNDSKINFDNQFNALSQKAFSGQL